MGNNRRWWREKARRKVFTRFAREVRDCVRENINSKSIFKPAVHEKRHLPF